MSFEGLGVRKICNPDIIKDYPDALIIIMVSMSYKKIISRLRNQGIRNEIMLAPLLGWRFIIDDFVPPEKLINDIPDWINNNKSELLNIYEKDDYYTKDLLNDIIKERSQFTPIDYSKYECLSNQQYFGEEALSPDGGIIFVDGGAYIGDSIEEMELTKRKNLIFSIGFEPDADNWKIATKKMVELGIDNKVKLVNKGMYDKDGILRFRKVGDEYSIDKEGDIETDVCRLDGYISDIDEAFRKSRNRNPQLCIKMDLEGSEVQALLGSKDTIGRYHPYMAICLYHRMKDILDVPKTIMGMRDDYKFYLRAGVHTEMYAVPQIG
ncbi:MAG: FkbM family methyltransferase [Lachnospiraceae bacterium]|nr:FkbM family methyltransferase [Lachnospiraceae bacterium]